MTDANDSDRSPDPGQKASSASEYQDILAGVLKDEKDRKAADEEAARRRQQRNKGRGNQPLMLGVLVIVSGYLWLGQPGFLEPAPLDPVPVELAEAGLRVEMTMYVRKIQQYRDGNGRLPQSLDEAYEPRDGFLYLPSGDSFRLVGTDGDLTVEYESGTDIDEFLGNAAAVIEEGVG